MERGAKFERKVAQKVGGKAVRGSGCTWFDKADIDTNHFKIECKSTGKAQYTLRAQILLDISRHARDVGKRPALVLELGGRIYTVFEGVEWLKVLDDYLEAV